MIKFIKRKTKYLKYTIKMVKEALKFYPWDYRYNLSTLRVSLEQTRDYIRDYGLEVDEGRLLKVERLNRAIQLLNIINDVDFITMAEKKLGKEIISSFDKDPDNDLTWISNDKDSAYNKVIFDESNKLEEEHYTELFALLKSDIQGWWD